MTDPTPDDLATLARAMGYTVTLDDSGGYGAVRVLVEIEELFHYHGQKPRFAKVNTNFCPHLDAAQAWEVMAWLGRQDENLKFCVGSSLTENAQSLQTTTAPQPASAAQW